MQVVVKMAATAARWMQVVATVVVVINFFFMHPRATGRRFLFVR